MFDAGMKRNLVLELIAILILSVFAFILAGKFDILELIFEYSREYEDWELDELFTTAVFLVFAFAFFSLRRLVDANNANNALSDANKELAKALAEIKQIKGIIPICSSCKKIRDENGDWHQVESYVSKHSDAEFSHGMCPECAKKWYPDCYTDEEK